MLAQPQLVEAELVGEHRLLAVLLERAPERAVRRMDRHHEHPEPHGFLPTVSGRYYGAASVEGKWVGRRGRATPESSCVRRNDAAFAQRMNRLRSAFLARSPMCLCT